MSARGATLSTPADDTPRRARARASRILRRLHALHADADCALHHESALQLLEATVLSAQCTDKRVNLVTPTLFKLADNPVDMAKQSVDAIKTIIETNESYLKHLRSLGVGEAQLMLARWNPEQRRMPL